ncbi:hypothetical protein SOPP22_06280 [Shewanella sp. OPT22]|nr:hypothetical protein SOPP22_06280 [Shewanella sp. OPT22]
MQKVRCIGLISCIAATAFIAACHDSDKDKKNVISEKNTKFLYTSTNSSIASEGNKVIGFKIAEDGSLTEFDHFPTGGIGDADDGDFDAQGAMRVIGDKLLVINAGESTPELDDRVIAGNGSISVFQIDDITGDLARIDQRPDVAGVHNMDSFGLRPVTLDSLTVDGTTWVVVGNQTDTEHCITPAEVNPTLETCLGHGTENLGEYFQRVASKQAYRNIYLFKFEGGVLTPVKKLADYDARVSGPAQVSFSHDGTKLAVTTIGIGHISQVSNKNLQSPARTYVYDVTANSDNFSIDNARWFGNQSIAVSVGFSWSSDDEYIYVSNAILAEGFTNYSLMSLDVSNTDTVFTSDDNSTPSGDGGISITLNSQADDRPAACWTWLTPKDEYLFGVAFRTNLVPSYQVEGAMLSRIQEVKRRNIDVHDSKDIYVSGNGKTLYVLGGLQTHTVSIFDLESGFLTEKVGSPLQVKASINPDTNENRPNTEHFYLGIAGYPNYYTGF